FLESTPLQVHFDFPEAVPPRSVSGAFRRHLLLLVKEALQNVVKHAAAKQVRMRLALAEGRLELSIADDGRGLPPNGSTASGHGLPNMRHGVSELKGSFELISQPGHGTEIRVIVPLASPAK